ncbi:MAG: prepilin-type N-terminal cleavage/methylation domain-containing protein [Elusimicrobia bacterium]|nr:prepilin-type N-terminal cleavage/methylation domain-containing protein [Elusimicrobiota bacterium]
MKKRISLLKYCKLKNDHGFTLVEMLIASVILSLVISTVYFTYRTAMNNSRNLHNKLELYQNAQAALDIISSDLRGAFRELKGDKTQMAFVTSHAGAHFGERNIGITAVKYYLQEGLIQEEKLPEGLIKGLPKEAYTTLVASLITELVFSYFDDGQWATEWDSGISGKLPQSVKISVRVKSADQHYPEELSLETSTPIFSGKHY